MASPSVLLVLLLVLSTSVAYRPPSVFSKTLALQFLDLLNRAATRGPRVIDTHTSTPFAYIKCVGSPGRKYAEIKTKADFSNDMVAWRRVGQLVKARPFGNDLTIFDAKFGDRVFEMTISNNGLVLRVAKERGCR